MNGMVRINNRGFNLENIDTWKWEKSSGYLWLYFTGSEQPTQLEGGEAVMLHKYLENSSEDVVKWNEMMNSIRRTRDE